MSAPAHAVPDREPGAGALQRAHGAVRLRVRLRHGQTRIEALRQEGCLKLLFPRMHGAGPLEAVAVNSSGGIASGDLLATDLDCAPGAHLLATAQAAERCYRARPGDGPARVETRLRVGEGATLEWLPQETILFDGAALDRRLEVELAPDARLLALESRVFGRALHGERLRTLDLADRLVIRRGGLPLLVDQLILRGDAEARLARTAVGAGARACAVIVLAGPEAAAMLDPVRARLSGDAGASSWRGMLVVRIVSRDPAAHRGLIAAVLACLRPGRALPAVWRQ